MTGDQEVKLIKVLEGLEKLMSKSSQFTGQRETRDSSSSAKTSADRESGNSRRDKEIFTVSRKEVKETTEAMQALTGRIGTLSKAVGITAGKFTDLNDKMETLISTLGSGGISTPSNKVSPVVQATVPAQPAAASARAAQRAAQPAIRATIASTRATAANTDALNDATHSGNKNANLMSRWIAKQLSFREKHSEFDRGDVISKMFYEFEIGRNSFGLFVNMIDKASEAIKRVTSDWLHLSDLGLSSSSALMDVYKNALLSGMGLKEYSKLLQDSSTALNKFTSIDAFDKIQNGQKEALAKLGVFGADAAGLTMSLAQSNTMLGVSRTNLDKAGEGQISVFAELRKSTLMTADGFADLVKSMSENEKVTDELVGLSGAERTARMNELLSMTTIGQRYGLLTAQSKALADAMLAVRNETIAQRVDQGGRIQQLGAVVGMGAQANRAAQLQMKGKGKTKAEEAELASLAQSIEAAAQATYNQAAQNNNYGLQNAIEGLREPLDGGPLGQLMKATKPLELATDKLGQVVNQLGDTLGGFATWFGNFTTVVTGFFKSPLESILSAFGAGLLFVFRKSIFNAFGNILPKLGINRITPPSESVSPTGVKGSLVGLPKIDASMAPMGQAAAGVAQTADEVVVATSKVSKMWNGIKTFGKSYLKFVPFVSQLIMAYEFVSELITGANASTINSNVMFGDKLISAGIGAISWIAGIPAWIGDKLAEASNYLFGTDFSGKYFENMVDKGILGVTAFYQDMYLKIQESILSFFDFLHIDTPFIKDLRKNAETRKKTVAETRDVQKQLEGDSSLTLAEMKKRREGTSQAIKAEVDKNKKAEAINSVNVGMITASQLRGDAKTLQSNTIQANDVSTPSQSPTVNKQATQTPATPVPTQAPQTQNTNGQNDINNIVAYLSKSNDLEKQQADILAAMLQLFLKNDKIKPMSKFESSEDVLRMVTSDGNGMAL